MSDSLPSNSETNTAPGGAASQPNTVSAAPLAVPQVVYPWAVAPQAWIPEQTEPLGYHRLLRGMKRYEWWKPLVMLVLCFAFYLGVSIIIGIFLGIWFALSDNPLGKELFAGGDPAQAAEAMLQEIDNPLVMLVTFGSVALMLPTALLAMLVFGKDTMRRVWSVALRIRWKLFWKFMLAAVAVYLVVQGAGVLLGLQGNDTGHTPSPDFGKLIILFLVALLIVPLQAIAEEVVFRGVLLQAIGSWVKSPVLAVVVTSIVFGLLHIQYNFWGILAVTIMGVTAAILTLRTGGLEAAMAVHVINNLAVLLLTTSGLVSADTSSYGPLLIVGEIILMGTFYLAAEFIWRKELAAGKEHAYRIDWVEKLRPIAFQHTPAANTSFVSTVDPAAQVYTPPGTPTPTPVSLATSANVPAAVPAEVKPECCRAKNDTANPAIES